MIVLRSIVFNILFYANLIGLVVFGAPLLLGNRFGIIWLAQQWGRNSLFLLRVVCGTRVEFRGLENIPVGGFLIAPKHQSIWETFALLPFFPDFSFVLKRELTWIPFFGWLVMRGGQMAINRSAGSSALAQVARNSRAYLADGRQVFIFPEGTRRPIGSKPEYKFGIAHVYSDTGARCLPVALNAGLFWPRRSFLRRPGTVLVQFLPVIEPGVEKAAFLTLLQSQLEAATNALIAESVAADASLAQMLPPDHPLRQKMAAAGE